MKDSADLDLVLNAWANVINARLMRNNLGVECLVFAGVNSKICFFSKAATPVRDRIAQYAKDITRKRLSAWKQVAPDGTMYCSCDILDIEARARSTIASARSTGYCDLEVEEDECITRGKWISLFFKSEGWDKSNVRDGASCLLGHTKQGAPWVVRFDSCILDVIPACDDFQTEAEMMYAQAKPML